MFSKLQLTTFENASIIRKFTIFYFLASILPLAVLDFMYIQLQTKGTVEITEQSLKFTLLFVVFGVGIGYFMMRSLLSGIVRIAQKNASTIVGILGPEHSQFLNSQSSNEIEILTQSFNEITNRLEENVHNLEAAKRTLHSVLARVGEGMVSMENIDSFLSLIVETVTSALQARMGFLFIYDDKDQAFVIKNSYGRKFDSKKRLHFDLLNGPFAPIVQTHQAIVIDRCPKEPPYNIFSHPPLLCAPLVLHEKILGLIVVSDLMAGAQFGEEEKNIFNNIALQTAVAIENSRLNEDAEKTYFETIAALAMAVEAKDTYSRGHSDRVASYALLIAQQMGLGQEDMTTLRDAAKLHDLGKIGILDRILKKEAPLDTEEREMMKKHSEIGEGIIKPIRSLRHLCDLIRHHHEKLNGTGYPDGLKGGEISTLTRILAVADIYDAMTTNRPYREPFSPQQAIAEMRAMNNEIDQTMVDALEKSILQG